MRVITGTARGRKLKELPGLDTRPTTDRVKESIFNIIQFDVEGRRVLDLFGGSGQLTIEALSRGAAEATIVELNPAAVKIIRENVESCGFADNCRIVAQEGLTFLSGAGEKFHLVFLDPPYAGPLMDQALERIAAIDIVSENGIIVCESALDKAMPELPAPYEKGKEYRYGKIKVTIYRRKA